MTTYTFQIGETISIALDAVQGDTATVSAITAALRKLNQGRTGFADDSIPVAMSVAARAAAGDIPAGWNITLAAAASAALDEGYFGADARLTVGGGVIVTDFVTVRMRAAASAP